MKRALALVCLAPVLGACHVDAQSQDQNVVSNRTSAVAIDPASIEPIVLTMKDVQFKLEMDPQTDEKNPVKLTIRPASQNDSWASDETMRCQQRPWTIYPHEPLVDTGGTKRDRYEGSIVCEASASSWNPFNSEDKIKLSFHHYGGPCCLYRVELDTSGDSPDFFPIARKRLMSPDLFEALRKGEDILDHTMPDYDMAVKRGNYSPFSVVSSISEAIEPVMMSVLNAAHEDHFEWGQVRLEGGVRTRDFTMTLFYSAASCVGDCTHELAPVNVSLLDDSGMILTGTPLCLRALKASSSWAKELSRTPEQICGSASGPDAVPDDTGSDGDSSAAGTGEPPASSGEGGSGEPPATAGAGGAGGAPATEGTCAGATCSGASLDGTCYCDTSCAEIGDCCPDKLEHCPN